MKLILRLILIAILGQNVTFANSVNSFAIQFDSGKSLQESEKLVEQFKQFNLPIYILNTPIDGVRLNRVIMGTFVTRKGAEEFLSFLKTNEVLLDEEELPFGVKQTVDSTISSLSQEAKVVELSGELKSEHNITHGQSIVVNLEGSFWSYIHFFQGKSTQPKSLIVSLNTHYNPMNIGIRESYLFHESINEFSHYKDTTGVDADSKNLYIGISSFIENYDSENTDTSNADIFSSEHNVNVDRVKSEYAIFGDLLMTKRFTLLNVYDLQNGELVRSSSEGFDYVSENGARVRHKGLVNDIERANIGNFKEHKVWSGSFNNINLCNIKVLTKPVGYFTKKVAISVLFFSDKDSEQCQ